MLTADLEEHCVVVTASLDLVLMPVLTMFCYVSSFWVFAIFVIFPAIQFIRPIIDFLNISELQSQYWWFEESSSNRFKYWWSKEGAAGNNTVAKTEKWAYSQRATKAKEKNWNPRGIQLKKNHVLGL